MLLEPTARAGGFPYQHFVSRPDLQPPGIRILTPAHRTAPGYIFIAVKRRARQPGPMIFDNKGRLVWFFRAKTKGVTDFRVQRYRNRPVLTWWQARPEGVPEGRSSYRIVDGAYHTVRVVRPLNGALADPHEFLLTSRGTALMTTYRNSKVGDRRVANGGVQELDLRTGRLLLDWRAIRHVHLSESYTRAPKDKDNPYDYFHVNSIHVDVDGNLLVSARNTHAIYKVDRRNGRIIWRLGGKRSDWRLGKGVRFAWQHDARRLRDGTISLFDNGAAPRVHDQSRVIFVRLNRRRNLAQLARAIRHRPPIVSINQANAQRLPNWHTLVGWGYMPYVTEYDRRNRVRLDLQFGEVDFSRRADSYRAYRFRWAGDPVTRPSLAIERGYLFVSWNGATRVARWQILGGDHPRRMRAIRVIRKAGFETSVAAPRQRWVAVRALDRAGRTLRLSNAIHRRLRPRPLR